MKCYIITSDDIQAYADFFKAYKDGQITWAEFMQGAQRMISRPVPDWATHFAGDWIAGGDFMQAEKIFSDHETPLKTQIMDK